MGTGQEGWQVRPDLHPLSIYVAQATSLDTFNWSVLLFQYHFPTSHVSRFTGLCFVFLSVWDELIVTVAILDISS